MTSPMTLIETAPFWKMNGLGNEIVVLDVRAADRAVTADEARSIAGLDGLFYDQLMVLNRPADPATAARVEIFNRDGSRAGACGNGMRCVARVVAEATGEPSLAFTVDDRSLMVSARDPMKIAVDMGEPRFEWHEIPLAEEFRDTRYIELQVGPIDAPVLHSPSVVNMGNPHAVFWVDDVDSHDLARHGPLLEHHPIFPEAANISLAAVAGPDHLRVRTWERGVGLTKACGSAACAAAVSAARTRRTGRTVRVTVPGGDLTIRWSDTNRVIMTGPAEHEWAGRMRLTGDSAEVVSDDGGARG